MSLETVQTATEQPAQVAQTSSEKGAGNTSISDFAKKIAAAQVAPAAFTPKTEAKAEVKTEAAPVTEEAKQAPAEETTPEPETEAKAEPAEETEEETSEVLSPETRSLDPKLQEKINRRIGKEVAKRKALEQEVASLKQLVTERPQEVEKEVVVQVPDNVPLAEFTSLDKLNEYKESLANDIVEAEMLLYSDFPPEGMQTKWGVVTKPALIAALTQAKKTERTAIPAREKFLQSRTSSQQTALEKFPFLKDPTHPGYQMAQAAKRDPANAWLRGLPNADYILGVQIKGLLAMQSEESAKAKPEAKTTAKPKPKPTSGQSEITSDASISRAPTGLINSNALQVDRAKITGGKKSLGHKDFAELLKANQRFRNSQ